MKLLHPSLSSSSEPQLSDSITTNPFNNQIKESAEFKQSFIVQGDPGIVAKLMGLDSIPKRTHSAISQTERLNLIKQSQSMALSDLENDKFFIQSFNGGCKDEQSERKLSNKREIKKETLAPIQKVETEYGNDGSNPFSFLDFVQFPDRQQVLNSGTEDLKSKRWNSRGKLTKDLEGCKHGSSCSSRKIYKLIDGSKKMKFWGICGGICKLGVKETMETSNGVFKRICNGKRSEEFRVDFELEFFDELIGELVYLF